MVTSEHQISVPPKPSKDELTADQYIQVVKGHHQAVAELMDYCAHQLQERGAAHDMDKIDNLEHGIAQPQVGHREQGHHWYATDNHMLPTLFDILEMCADTVATTAGKQAIDPWVRQWLPPLQSSEWWDDVIRRTELQLSEQLDAPLLNPRRPIGVETNREEDD